ncbi:MFS transporter [Bradyrhizobium sp. OAE829]|uniref:MFS transporter n=1 Tax=Bradyrhizobium sp. OAE829 TaxID=2663807 RepID=UPI0033943EE1
MSNSPFRRMIGASTPDFWRLWYVGLIVAIVRWLETVAVGIVVYQRTDSAFLVSMMTMLRVLPMGLFGVFLGALAERFDRGRVLLIVVLLMIGTSAILAVLDRTRTARDLASRARQLHQWVRLVHRQPGAPRDDR